MTYIRRDVGERPVCPLHPGSQIHIDHTERVAANGYFAGVGFRCVHAGGRHRIRQPFLTRTMTAAHPSAGGKCPECGRRHAPGTGHTVACSYTYSILDMARALVRVGRGETFTDIAAGVRADCFRTTGAPRPTCAGRPWLPRGTMLPTATERAPRRRYDYGTPREPGSLGGPFSRSATTVCSWTDVFAPEIIAAFAPDHMPRAIALDSKPIKRRRYQITKKGVARPVQSGERNGENMIVADRSTAPTTPILVAVEGGKDHRSWLRIFERLPAGEAPTWVVADLDAAIRRAVSLAWPDAILYHCEEHLREAMRNAATRDHVPEHISRKLAKKLEPGTPDAPKKVRPRRATVDMVDHPLFARIGASLSTPEAWADLAAAVERFIPPEHTALRRWMADREALVRHQFALKAQHPGMPHSTGGVENALRTIGGSIERRSASFTNARRLDLVLGLMRLDLLNLASETAFAAIIQRTLAARNGAGMDWQEGRDVLGTSSLDELVDAAMGRSSVARSASQDAGRAARTANARGDRPSARVTRTDGGAHTRYRVEAHQTVADIELLASQWRPEENDGLRADEVSARDARKATWVCTAHGHIHRWQRRVFDRARTRSMCPYCAHRQACETTSLAGQFPELMAEWDAEKNVLDPTKILAGSDQPAFWRCPVHGTYSARISARTYQSEGCASCAAAKRASTTRSAAERRGDAARARRDRKLASQARPLRTPPVLADPVSGDTSELVTVAETAATLGRSRGTITNWIKAGRIATVPGVRGIPASEVARLAGLLGRT